MWHRKFVKTKNSLRCDNENFERFPLGTKHYAFDTFLLHCHHRLQFHGWPWSVHISIKQNDASSVFRQVPTASPNPTPIPTSSRLDLLLQQRGLSLMVNGIASSTRRTYTTTQRSFIEFCYSTKLAAPPRLSCPASAWTLIHLAVSLKANSIKGIFNLTEIATHRARLFEPF